MQSRWQPLDPTQKNEPQAPTGRHEIDPLSAPAPRRFSALLPPSSNIPYAIPA